MRTSITTFALAVFASGVLTAEQPPASATTEPVPPTSFEFMSYPPIAVAGRVEGAVVVQIRIDARGRVTTATAISGPPLLRPSARDNATTWTFPDGPERESVLTYLFEIDGFCYRTPAPTLFRIRPPYDLVAVTTCQHWRP